MSFICQHICFIWIPHTPKPHVKHQDDCNITSSHHYMPDFVSFGLYGSHLGFDLIVTLAHHRSF